MMKYISYLNSSIKTFAVNFIKNYGYFTLFLITGLAIFTYPMFLSGFDLMPGDSFDVKSFAYILEHSYKWVLREPLHLSLFDIPFYYPMKNTLFLSDTLIGLMPLFWLARVFLDNAFSAVQALLFILCTLNYSTFYYLLNKQLKQNSLFSSVGAFLFAFSLLRYYRLCHLNYFSQFYTVLALIFLLKVNSKNSNLKNHVMFLLFSLFLILQFYTCYSLAFYFCFLGAFAVIVSLFFKTSRKQIVSFVICFYAKIIFYALFLAVMLYPLAYHYLNVGMSRDMSDVLIYIQPISAWVKSLSILDNLMYGNLIEFGNIYTVNELYAGMGILTGISALIGISKIKQYRTVIYIVLVFIVLCSCRIFDFVFWRFFFDNFFGAQGIRAIIRISLMTLLIFPVGICYWLNFLKEKNTKLSKIILILSILLIMAEQIPYKHDVNSNWKTYSWSKSKFVKQIKQYSKLFKDDTKVILLEPKYENGEGLTDSTIRAKIAYVNVWANALGTWLSMELNKPTLSGYSGFDRSLDYSGIEGVEVEYVIYDLKKIKFFEDL